MSVCSKYTFFFFFYEYPEVDEGLVCGCSPAMVVSECLDQGRLLPVDVADEISLTSNDTLHKLPSEHHGS